MSGRPECLFYHLERQPLERVLPQLLERTLQRGWRAVVEAGSQERVDALDTLLWTYSDDSFLPHGTEKDGAAARQPVYLTSSAENPNGAVVRFLVDGAPLDSLEGYERIVVLFDGTDEAALARVREGWRQVKAAGCEATYWQQNPTGKWTRRA
jgi:DNA polymerase-3 subunit chi